jgi:serine/threonine-protein kinase
LERWVVSAPPSRPPSVPGWLGTSEVAITPDGETVFYLYDSEEGFHNLYRRRVGELEGVVLTADLGVHSPFVSPGGEWVAFLHAGALERMPVGGGPTATLLPRRRVIRGAGWGDDGAIVLAQLTPEAGLFRLGADEHEPEKLLSLGEGEIQFAHPEVMPGSGAVLFTVRTEERSAIAVLELETRERRILIPEGSRPQYASSGHLVFGRESHLYGVPFDAAKLAVRGEPVRVLEDLVVTEWHTEGPSFSLSAAGHLVYVTEDRRSVSPRKLVWIDRRGHREDVPAPTGDFEELRISPDGRRVVLEKDAPTNRIWMWDFALGTLTPLDSEGLGYGPAWSPDGTRILFARNKPGSDHALLYERAADGSGTVRQLSEEIVFDPFSITSDEKWLVHRVLRLGNDDLDARPFDGGESLRLLSSPADERNGALSPDDRWLAYESNETGRFEIEVRPFPDVERGRWYVSSGGGRHPLWSPDGRELYYVGARGMMAAAIDVDEAGIRPQKPRLLFEWQTESVS